MNEVSQLDVPNDGIVFEAAFFSGVAVREAADYSGVRTVFMGRFDAARVHMQIDIAFGDVVTPEREELSYPTILDFPVPVLFGYTRQTVMAEKLQALDSVRR